MAGIAPSIINKDDTSKDKWRYPEISLQGVQFWFQLKLIQRKIDKIVITHKGIKSTITKELIEQQVSLTKQVNLSDQTN